MHEKGLREDCAITLLIEEDAIDSQEKELIGRAKRELLMRYFDRYGKVFTQYLVMPVGIPCKSLKSAKTLQTIYPKSWVVKKMDFFL